MKRQSRQLYEAHDFYATLNLNFDSSAGDVKRHYRNLAFQWHPDKHPEGAARARATDIFQRIQAAYDVLIDKAARENYDAVWYRVHRSRAGSAVPDWALHAGQRSASMERAPSEISRVESSVRGFRSASMERERAPSEISRAPARDGLSRSPTRGPQAWTPGHNARPETPVRGPRRTSPARPQELRPARSSQEQRWQEQRSPGPRSHEPRSQERSPARGLHRNCSSGSQVSRSQERRSQEPRSPAPQGQEPRSQESRSPDPRRPAHQGQTLPERRRHKSPDRFKEPGRFGSHSEADAPADDTTPRTIQSRRRNTASTGSAASPTRRAVSPKGGLSPKAGVASFDITGSWALIHSSGITCILTVTQESGGAVFCGSQAVADARSQPDAPQIRGGVHGTSAVWRMVESGALYEARLEESGSSMAAGHYWAPDGRELGTFSASRLQQEEEDTGQRSGPLEHVVFKRPPPPGSAEASRPKASQPRNPAPRPADSADTRTDTGLAPADSTWGYVSSTFGATLRGGAGQTGAGALAWAFEQLLDPPKARTRSRCTVCRGPCSFGATLCSECDRPVYVL